MDDDNKIIFTREGIIEMVLDAKISLEHVEQILNNQENLKKLKQQNTKRLKGIAELMGSNFALTEIKNELQEKLDRIEEQTNESFSADHQIRNIKVILKEAILDLAQRKEKL